jgi:hypothetical protein
MAAGAQGESTSVMTPPATVPPPGGPRWTWGSDRFSTSKVHLYVLRIGWADVRAQSSGGAYWIRYPNWTVILRWGRRQWWLQHYIEREP